MKKTLLLMVAALLCVASSAVAFAAATPGGAYVEGEILALVETGVGATSESGDVESLASSVGASVSAVYDAAEAYTGRKIVLLSAPGRSSDALEASAASLPGVVGTSKNYVVSAWDRIPNDAYWNLQKGFERVGVAKVWDSNTGSDAMFAAIVDTGIDWNHPDLAANSGLDLDGRRGYNAVAGDYNPMDDQGHGTHVAGTVGAVGNNGAGVAGMSWKTKLLPVKVLGSDGSGTYSTIIAGLDYVVKQKTRGLDIRTANMSLGGWSPVITNPATHPFGAACKAVSDAGILLLVAAGNENQNIASPSSYPGQRPYPASFAFDNMITVGSIGNTGARSSFSNYGPDFVHLAAPGESVPSALRGGGYGYMSGTSMATPHVAGAAQLLFAANPGMPAGKMKSRILGAAKPSSLLSLFKYGELDISALGGTVPPTPTPVPTPVPTPAPTPAPVVPVQSITLSQKSATLDVGSSLLLKATVLPANAANKTVTWTSSRPTVASVDANGAVSAHNVGSTVITASSHNGKKATCSVTVKRPPVRVSGITLSPKSISLYPGKRLSFKWSVAPANASDKRVSWSSSDPNVAFVSSSGLMTAKSVGKTVVTVKTLDGGKTASCTVTVLQPVVYAQRVVLSPTSMSLETGKTGKFTASLVPTNVTNKNILWSSSNPRVATVAADGTVKALVPGATLIAARSGDGRAMTATTLRVTAPPPVRVKRITLSPSSVKVGVGSVFKLKPTLSPANAANTAVAWTSSNPRVALVLPDGTVLARSVGSVKISAKTRDGGYVASITATVIAQAAKKRVSGFAEGIHGFETAAPAFPFGAADERLLPSDEYGASFLSPDALSYFASEGGFSLYAPLPVFETAAFPGGGVAARLPAPSSFAGRSADAAGVVAYAADGSQRAFVQAFSFDELAEGSFIVVEADGHTPVSPESGIPEDAILLLTVFDGGEFDADEREGFVSCVAAVVGEVGESAPLSDGDSFAGGTAGCSATAFPPSAALLALPLLVAFFGFRR